MYHHSIRGAARDSFGASMRFTCDRCGKRYASVDEPVPGRIYRVRCGSCGELMRVTAALPDRGPEAEAGPALLSADADDARAALDSALVRQAHEAGVAVPGAPGDETDEIPVDLGLSDEFPLARRRRVRLAALALSASALLALVALAGMLRGAGARRAVEAPATPDARHGVTVPAPPESAAPSAPAPAAPEAAAPPPARRPTAPPTASGKRSRPAPPAKPPGVAFEPRASARSQRSSRVDAGLAETLSRKEDVSVTTGLADLSELQAVLEARRADLERCADEARGTSAGALWAGRQPQVVVTVQPGGEATGRVDDAALEATDLAACLRRVVARTPFPPFRGDPVELRTPAPIP